MIQYKKYFNKKKSVILLAFIPFLFGCQSWVEPALENIKDENSLANEAQLAQQTLGHAYLGNPLGGYSFNDVATDDAVSNDFTNSYLKIATGQWRSNNSPMNGDWQNRRGSIQYINLFISFLKDVEWSKDDRINTMFIDRMNGDAHGMRALFTYYLLLEHAGWTADGQLLGIPLLTEPETTTSNFNLPRNTFAECIDSIRADVQIAAGDLPLFYAPDGPNDIFKDSDVPSRYRKDYVTASEYLRVFGNSHAGGRMSGAIAEAILAQAYLLAASPAYSQGSGVTWEQAANQMATVLSTLGSNPISQIDPTGNTWYQKDAPGAGINPKEILWRGDRVQNGHNDGDIERDNFPPTLYGRGRINPTQNLVDAFPMSDGYPISQSSSYNPNKPYDNRDPRLGLYIVYNGSQLENSTITTAADGITNDALLKTETSTRTGYYMRKLLRPGVVANPSQPNDQYRYKAFIRYTEIFLGYAEAANEAWGPQGTGSNGYSAYDVIKAIRTRAGITGGDAYLESIKGDQNAMRELIHNERRLELCFEGNRFWDLRRWKASITDPAQGVSISGGIPTLIPVVEQRAYADYMYYAPIPYSEILKFSALVQNKGW